MFDRLFSQLLLGLIDSYEFLFFWAPAIAGAALVFAGNATKKKDQFAAAAYAVVAIPGLAVVLLHFAIPELVSWYRNIDYSYPLWHLVAISVEFSAGLFAGLWWFRVGAMKADEATEKLTKRSALERNKKTDIREIHKFIPGDKKFFDPRKSYDPKKGLFLGFDENNKSVFIKDSDWELSHILLSGRTRSGKGVAAQALGQQSIKRGDFFIVLDPKIDNFMPHTYHAAATECGQPYAFLDLNPGALPQFNIFDGCDAETIENMLIGAFSLAEKGEAADFYRLADRKAARQLAAWVWENSAQNPANAGKAIYTPTARDAVAQFGSQWAEECAGFAAYMAEMAEIPAVNRKTPGGLDLLAMEQSGGCLYTVGDMINPRVIRLQRMLLVRLLFLAKTRDYMSKTPRLMTVFADEFKCHISRPFMLSLGASLGWRLKTILAFQSLQDLADCPADLNADSVKGSVMENCAIQLSYQIKDPDTKEWLARSTGVILADDESRKVERNVALAESMEDSRTIKQSERYLIDENMFGSLPIPNNDKGTCGCAVLAVAGHLARFCYTSRVPTERTPAAIAPTFAVDEAVVAGSVAAAIVALDELDDAGDMSEGNASPDPFDLPDLGD